MGCLFAPKSCTAAGPPWENAIITLMFHTICIHWRIWYRMHFIHSYFTPYRFLFLFVYSIHIYIYISIHISMYINWLLVDLYILLHKIIYIYIYIHSIAFLRTISPPKTSKTGEVWSMWRTSPMCSALEVDPDPGAFRAMPWKTCNVGHDIS